MLKVGEQYGVSSSYLARVCTRMNVPRPERGYWAKLAVGKAPQQIPLPEAHPGDELVWSRDGTTIDVPRPLPKPPASKIRNPQSEPSIGTEHPLVRGAKSHFESGRLSYEAEYLKPSKRLLLDLAVTKGTLDRALAFANQLFLALEEKGYRVLLAPNAEHLSRQAVDERENPPKHGYHHNNLWSPHRPTIVYIGTVAIGLTIVELSEQVKVRYVKGKYVRETDYVSAMRSKIGFDQTWTSQMAMASGRLCLQAYSPYYRTDWLNQWRDTKTSVVESQVKVIIKTLEQAAVEIAADVEVARRQAEAEHQQWEVQRREREREREERRVAEAIKESRKDLRDIIDRWAKANRIEQFFSDAELLAAGMEKDEKAKLLDRLRRARELIGSIDALDHFMNWKSPEER